MCRSMSECPPPPPVAPIIVTPPKDVSVELGRTVTFWCISVGSPEPQNRFTHTRRFITSDVDSDERILVSIFACY